MERWKIYAFAAALFAGLTSVVAKAGLKNLSADAGLAIRTTFVFVFVIANLFLWTSAAPAVAALKSAGGKSIALLALFASGSVMSIGFVTLFGISMRNSIMLLSHYEHLVLEGGAEWNVETVARGASERVVPIY